MSIMQQQFGASVFYTVECWHKLSDFYRLGYPFAKNYQICWRFNEVLTKTSCVIFGTPCRSPTGWSKKRSKLQWSWRTGNT